jgi:hypothetical protein
LIGVYSPPQTPNSKFGKANPLEIARPETPPPSTHRLEIPVSPETPTHSPIRSDNGDASLFDDNNRLSQPTTPVLYNLIRNEGPPMFVIQNTESSSVKENADPSESMFS